MIVEEVAIALGWFSRLSIGFPNVFIRVFYRRFATRKVIIIYISVK